MQPRHLGSASSLRATRHRSPPEPGAEAWSPACSSCVLQPLGNAAVIDASSIPCCVTWVFCCLVPGPGPGRYSLPPTIGFVNHDYTRLTSPAYSLHRRLDDSGKSLLAAALWWGLRQTGTALCFAQGPTRPAPLLSPSSRCLLSKARLPPISNTSCPAGRSPVSTLHHCPDPIKTCS